MKRILSFLLIACICFSIVGCDKVKDANSSSLSSIITQAEVSSIDSGTENTGESSVSKEEQNRPTESAPNKKESNNISSSVGLNNNSSEESNYSVSANNTSNNNPSSNNKEKDTESEVFNLQEWINASSITEYSLGGITSEIIDIRYNYFITKDNSLYELSLNKPFSNGLHYKKIETDFKFIKFLDDFGGSYVIGTDRKIYTYKYGIEECTPRFSSYVDDITKVFSIYISYESDRRMCTYSNNQIYTVTGNLLYSFPQGENILNVYGETIETTKNIIGLQWI